MKGHSHQQNLRVEFILLEFRFLALKIEGHGKFVDVLFLRFALLFTDTKECSANTKDARTSSRLPTEF